MLIAYYLQLARLLGRQFLQWLLLRENDNLLKDAGDAILKSKLKMAELQRKMWTIAHKKQLGAKLVFVDSSFGLELLKGKIFFFCNNLFRTLQFCRLPQFPIIALRFFFWRMFVRD